MAIEEKVADATFDEETVDTQSVKCENCGSNLIYNPELGKLFCTHCDSTLDVQSFQAKEQDIYNAFESEEEHWDKGDVELLQCENCGAKTVFNGSESAKTCPFWFDGSPFAKRSGMMRYIISAEVKLLRSAEPSSRAAISYGYLKDLPSLLNTR